MPSSKIFFWIARSSITPYNLIPKKLIFLSVAMVPDSIHHTFEIMTGCRVTVEVDTPCLFENTVHLREARSHKCYVCAHRSFVARNSVLENEVISFKAGIQCFVSIAGAGAAFYIGAGILRCSVPGPGIGEHFGLCKRIGEERVIVPAAIERRVCSDEVNAAIFHFTHDL